MKRSERAARSPTLRPLCLAARCLPLLLLLAATTAAAAAAAATAASPADEASSSVSEGEEQQWVYVHAGSAAGVAGGAAAQQLLVAALRAAGGRVRAVPPRAPCAVRDARDCLRATLAALDHRPGLALAAAVPAADSGWLAARAADLSLRDLGDAFPPARRVCLALSPRPHLPISTLMQLNDQNIAKIYSLSEQDINLLRNGTESDYDMCNREENCNNGTWSMSCCERQTCSSVVCGGEASEARALRDALQQGGVCARVVSLGARLAAALAGAHLPLIACDWSTSPIFNLRVAYTLLASPPCHTDYCPFETRRFAKFADANILATYPQIKRIFSNFSFTTEELQELSSLSSTNATEVSELWLARHPHWQSGWRPDRKAREVRVAALLPATGARQAYEAAALLGAAILAEDDGPLLQLQGGKINITYKVETSDDRCSAAHSITHPVGELGSGEYGALSALVGPACGAPLGVMAQLAEVFRLPVLAYTPQPPVENARWLLLAAGDARRSAEALAALLASYAWRRVGLLAEGGGRRALDASRLAAEVVHRLDLPDDSVDVDYAAIVKWAERCAAVKARVVVVSAEDARVLRAALCASRAAAGGTGAGGGGGGGRGVAQWLLAAPPHDRWLYPTLNDPHNCTHQQLVETAEGYMYVTTEWAWRWEQADTAAGWRRRWADMCERAALALHAGAPEDCGRPRAHAALLYDVLQLWRAALTAHLSAAPTAADDLHNRTVIRSLVDWVTTQPYTGLTGDFEWEKAEDNMARRSPMVIVQWNNGTEQRVASWDSGSFKRELKPRWGDSATAPDDGAERCALQALADALHGDCHAAFVAVCAGAVAALAALLAAAALHTKRRLERQYRERLAAVPLRSLHKLPPPDRWEVPRERLVINRRLGAGAFGAVYGGHALLPTATAWTAVAVKTLKPGAGTDEKLEFLSEAETMKRFSHANIVRLLGVVTATEPVCTVMEFMLYGDLKSYLLARRHLVGSSEGEPEVGARRLTALARDAARGLSYLHQQRYVHRDLAARNCLVSARRVLKLADFGMTRLVFEGDYYRFERKGLLPVRWMAPEALELGVFSGASDVWALGVLLYETVTLGALPHQGLSNRQVLTHVKAGGTPELPPGARPQLAALLRQCWRSERDARPRACEVAALLADAPRMLQPCVDLPIDPLPFDSDRQEVRRPRRALRYSAAPPTPDDDYCLLQSQWRTSWGAPTSAGTETSYLSADGAPCAEPTSPPPPLSPPPAPPPAAPASPAAPDTPAPDTQPLLAR